MWDAVWKVLQSHLHIKKSCNIEKHRKIRGISYIKDKISSVGGVSLCVRNSYISKSVCDDEGRTGGATMKGAAARRWSERQHDDKSSSGATRKGTTARRQRHKWWRNDEGSGGATMNWAAVQWRKQRDNEGSVSARRKAEPAARPWRERWCNNLESGGLRMKSAAGWGRQQWCDRRALAGDNNEERRMRYLMGT